MSLANRMCLCERHGRGVRCMVADAETQQRECPGYQIHPSDLVAGYCWFNYDACDEITDQCHRPGSLITPVSHDGE